MRRPGIIPPGLDESRRRFLRQTGAGALVVPVGLAAGPVFAQADTGGGDLPDSAVGRPMPQLNEEAPLPEAEKVGFAVVGLGKFALSQIIPAFTEAKQSRLVALVSGNRDKARSVARQYDVDEAALYDYAGFDRLADNPAVQVVYIILPNGLHAEYAIRAAAAGKHVMCEKPMALTVAECQEMIDAARKAERKLMVAYRAWFEPHNVEAMRRIKSGEIGPVRLYTSDHGRHVDPKDPADQWRLDKSLAGGGSLYDIGIYSLNGARAMLGEEPVEIHAMIDTPKDDPRFREVEDTVSWQMRFPSGAMALCSSSYSVAGVKSIGVIGAKARLRLDPATEYEGNRLTLIQGRNETQIQVKQTSQFAAEMDHLSECIRKNTAVRTPGEMGLQDVRLMQLIYESAREERPVTLQQSARQ